MALDNIVDICYILGGFIPDEEEKMKCFHPELFKWKLQQQWNMNNRCGDAAEGQRGEMGGEDEGKGKVVEEGGGIDEKGFDNEWEEDNLKGRE